MSRQKLLSEAHFPLYGRLSAVREEDESNGKVLHVTWLNGKIFCHKLLSEAHFPLYGRLSAVREEDESNGKASMYCSGSDSSLYEKIFEQKLLWEAHFPLYGRLSAVREEDESNGKVYIYCLGSDRSLYWKVRTETAVRGSITSQCMEDCLLSERRTSLMVRYYIRHPCIVQVLIAHSMRKYSNRYRIHDYWLLLHLGLVSSNGIAWNASGDCPLSEHSIPPETLRGQWPPLRAIAIRPRGI